MSKPILTQERVRELFIYDEETGSVVWRLPRPGTKQKVGYVHLGYIVVMVNGFNYGLHRLAWVYARGPIPHKMQIDHINHDRSDNRLENLRLVTNQQNQMNRLFTGNSSGFRGVYWDKSRNKWAPKIKINQRIINLGRFDTLEEAISARLSVEADYGFHANHGMILTN